MDRRKQRNVLIFLNILIVVVLIVSNFYHLVIYHDFTYKEGTTVGPIYVGGMNGSSLVKDLDNYVMEWKNTSSVYFVYQDKITNIDRTQISFDINRTVDSIKNGSDNKLYTSISRSYISYHLNDNYDVILSNVDLDSLEIDLEKQMGMLNNNIVINLQDYIVNPEQLFNEINTITISNINENKYNNLVNELVNESIEIDGESYFSLKKHFENTNLDDESLSIIATGIYELILTSNFIDIDKTNSDILPSYAKVGMDVLIDLKHNLSFYNPNKHPYQIQIIAVNNVLQFKLVGLPLVCDYEIEVEKVTIDKDIIYREDDSLLSGQVVEEGLDGAKINVFRLIRYNDGKIKRIWISQDIYLPENKVVIKSS